MSMYDIFINDVCYKVSLPHAETDYIQGKLASTGEPYELGMLQDMASRLQPGNLVLDVGANIGNHTLYLANVVQCVVHAFEPNAALCQGLHESIQANHLQARITVHQVGVSDTAGYATFDHLDESNLGAQSLVVRESDADSPIKLIRLDDLKFDQPVCMIKVDVEGMELNVLEGAVKLIQADKPAIYIEAHGIQEFEVLYSFLSALGYIYLETFNATPTHCFVNVSGIQGVQHLAAPLLEKARSLYANKVRLKQVLDGANKTRQSLSEAREKYRNSCQEISRLKNALSDSDVKVLELNVLKNDLADTQARLSELGRKYDKVCRDYRGANAKYRGVCREIGALKASKSYKASLHLKAASMSISDAVKLPVRLWRLSIPKKGAANRKLKLRNSLRYIKWNLVVPFLTRLGVPYSKVAHLNFPRYLSNISGVSVHPAEVDKSSIAVSDQEANVFIPPSGAAQEISILGWPEQPPNGKPYVMGIMDEFTAGCFEQEVNLIQPRPDNWYALAEKYRPVLIFIESAWKGNSGSWQYRVADYANKPGQEVAHICQYAREKGIPTLFWNKEDPVHHDKFMCAAELVEHIFTTDANMKDSYRVKTGNDNVHALPFAAQPALHKPAPLAGRKPLACFAGSWYGNRHAERGRAMRWLLEAANKHGLDIYDRNHGTGIFPFPEEYQASIKGSLPYKELCDEYSRYRVFLNVNSVTDSPTMFSRRVFELMACGTPIVSTYAQGIENLFESDAVWMVHSQEEAEEALHTLMTDDAEWRKRSLAGIREVFAKHTYAHRLNDIFDRLGIEYRIPTEPGIVLVAEAHSQAELDALIQIAKAQSYRRFLLGIECPQGIAAMTGHMSDHIVLLQSGEKTAWVVEQQAAYGIAGWLSSNSYYGEHYLRDLANASLYEPDASGWAKSIKHDLFAYGEQTELCSALWKTTVFVENYIHIKPDALLSRLDLYLADSAQFQKGRMVDDHAAGGKV